MPLPLLWSPSGKLLLTDVTTSRRQLPTPSLMEWTYPQDGRAVFDTSLPQDTIRSLDRCVCVCECVCVHVCKMSVHRDWGMGVRADKGRAVQRCKQRGKQPCDCNPPSHSPATGRVYQQGPR